MRALTVKQPWADLIMSGQKDVENRSWPVPSTLPQYRRCPRCGSRSVVAWDGPFGLPCHAHEAPEPTAWDGPFPFTLGIHAAATFADGWVTADGLYGTYRLLHQRTGRSAEWVPQDRLGVLLGTVQVTGCHHADECIDWDENEHEDDAALYCSRWAEPDCWHWTLADPVPLDVPVPMKGRQGLWTLTEVPS